MKLLINNLLNKWFGGTLGFSWLTWFSAENLEGTLKTITMIVGLIGAIFMLLKLINEYRITRIELKNKLEENERED